MYNFYRTWNKLNTVLWPDQLCSSTATKRLAMIATRIRLEQRLLLAIAEGLSLSLRWSSRL